MTEELLNKLNLFAHNFNISTTNLLSTNDIIDIARKKKNIRINYENSIELINIIRRFNELYQKFKEDYEKLPHLDLSLITKYVNSFDEDNSKLLVFDLYNTNNNLYNENGKITLYFYFLNNQYFAQLSNEKYHDERHCEQIDIDSEIIKNYLEVFGKHHDFLELYKTLKENLLYENGSTILFTKIKGNILDKLKTITLSFGNSFINKSEHIEVTFKLGETIEIFDYKLELDTFDKLDKDEIFEILTFMLNNLYINDEKIQGLSSLKNQESNKNSQTLSKKL